MAKLLGEGDLRGAAHDALNLEDAIDHVLQVVVGAGDHAGSGGHRAR